MKQNYILVVWLIVLGCASKGAMDSVVSNDSTAMVTDSATQETYMPLAPDNAEEGPEVSEAPVIQSDDIVYLGEETTIIATLLLTPAGGDCYRLIFSAGDFGYADIKMTEEDGWQLWTEITLDTGGITPEYLGNAFKITYRKTQAEVCMGVKEDVPQVIKFSRAGRSPVDFVHRNATLIDAVRGDLNADGIDDAVMIIDDKTEINSETDGLLRTLIILFGSKSGHFSFVTSSYDVALDSGEGGTLGDPYEGTKIEDGYVSMSFAGGSREKWEKSILFKVDDRKIKVFDNGL